MEKFKLYSEPPMEIHSITEVSDLFRAGGSLSFRLPRKSKKLFVKHTKRLNKLEMRRYAQRGVLTRLIYRVYFSYVMLIWVFISLNQSNLHDCLWVYSACISDIGTFKGENLNKDEISVTYNGRTANSEPVSRDPNRSTGFDWSEE